MVDDCGAELPERRIERRRVDEEVVVKRLHRPGAHHRVAWLQTLVDLVGRYGGARIVAKDPVGARGADVTAEVNQRRLYAHHWEAVLAGEHPVLAGQARLEHRVARESRTSQWHLLVPSRVGQIGAV